MSQFYTTGELTYLDKIHYPEITVKENSFTFITGKSGCGKSSYLKMLNGCIETRENTVFFQGRPLSDYDILSYRRQVLLVSQNVYLENGTVDDNFRFYYENREQELLTEEEIRKYLSIRIPDTRILPVL